MYNNINAVNKVYLVLGATEMVGAHLICAMLRQGFGVRAVKCPNGNTEYTKNILSLYSDDSDTLFNEIEWVEADYGDPDSMRAALEGVCSTFCCLSPRLVGSMTIDSNVETTRCIIDAVKDSGCPYFLYLSSICALGDENDISEIDENSQRNPKGKYSKLSNTYYRCEMEVRRAMHEGLNAGIINAANVIGPGDWKSDKSVFATGQFASKYYTEGVTGLVSVNDLVKSIMAMAKQRISGESFVVCGHNLCYRDFQTLFANELHNDPPTRKASKLRILLWKIKYAWQSMKTGRRPIINDEYFSDLTRFRIYSNRKSINRIIISYEPIEDTVRMICRLREKSLISATTSAE